MQSLDPNIDDGPDTPAMAFAAALAAVADTLAYPLLLLSPDGQLLHANRAGQALLQSSTNLGLAPDGRVTPRAANRRPAFLSSLRQAANGTRQPLVWRDDPAPMHAWICPLAQSGPGMPAPPLMLALAPPTGTRLDVSGFADSHGLTRAQTRVLEHTLAGLNAQAVALTLGVGVATVRTHLMGIRRKTGHQDVPALLTALRSLPPLLPPPLPPLMPLMPLMPYLPYLPHPPM